jgi:hypothetical protein
MLDRRVPCVAFLSCVGSHRALSGPAALGAPPNPPFPSRPAAATRRSPHRRWAWELFEGSRVRWLPVNPLRLAILSASLLCWATPVHAATVAIVRPLRSTPELHETLSRIHGELLSVGIEVEIADRPAGRGLGPTDFRAWLVEMAAARGACAVIDIVGDTVPSAVDVWVIEKSPPKVVVSRVAVEPNTESAAERLAIRAIEVLRSSFLEIDLAARQRRGEPITQLPTAALPQGDVNARVRRPELFAVEAGAAVLTSLDGVGPALSPLLRVRWAIRPWLALQAAASGLGSRPTVATTAGNARVAQQYGVLGGSYRFRSDQRLRPFFAISAGVLRTSVEGQADSPKQGHNAVKWSFLAEGSLGLGLHLGDRYYLTLAAHVQAAAPYVAIHFMDSVVATSGRPNLLMTLTLGAWL